MVVVGQFLCISSKNVKCSNKVTDKLSGIKLILKLHQVKSWGEMQILGLEKGEVSKGRVNNSPLILWQELQCEFLQVPRELEEQMLALCWAVSHLYIAPLDQRYSS